MSSDPEVLPKDWRAGGDVEFEADGLLGRGFAAAVAAMSRCVVTDGGEQILYEGGTYPGCWVESTGSISAEVLARFAPATALATLRRMTMHPRADGLLPYKWTGDGPSYRQIQMVSPLARSVWNAARLTGDAALIADSYPGLAGHDRWLAEHRDTLGTGGVEAFCTYDTGHDRSPRFWHIPDVPAGDATAYDRDNPRLPFVAPDLTANVACQRTYLGRMAAELGEDPEPWIDAAGRSEEALFAQCWDEADETFYDRDGQGNPVRILSDVLLRVLACEIGDDALFERALRRYLLDTRHFFAAYPFTSISLSDPRFDPRSDHNTWAGATNLLTMIRAPHAFEAHGRYVELSWAIWPTLAALAREATFGQTISPWTGEQSFTSDYSPAALTFLDFLERSCGILPRPDGTVWLTGLRPPVVGHDVLTTETAYRRTVGGERWELRITADGCRWLVDGRERLRFGTGLRVGVVQGAPATVTCLVASGFDGEIGGVPMSLAANEVAVLDGAVRASGAGLVLPQA